MIKDISYKRIFIFFSTPFLLLTIFSSVEEIPAIIGLSVFSGLISVMYFSILYTLIDEGKWYNWIIALFIGGHWTIIIYYVRKYYIKKGWKFIE